MVDLVLGKGMDGGEKRGRGTEREGYRERQRESGKKEREGGQRVRGRTNKDRHKNPETGKTISSINTIKLK